MTLRSTGCCMLSAHLELPVPPTVAPLQEKAMLLLRNLVYNSQVGSAALLHQMPVVPAW